MFPIIAIVLLVALLCWSGAILFTHILADVVRAERRSRLTPAVNIGEGVHGDGKLGHLLPDAAITARYLLVKKGSDPNHIALTGVGDIPLGICTDSTPTPTNDLTIPLSVRLFGAAMGTARVTAAGVINDGDLLVPAANGQVRTLPTTSGTYYIIGRALLPAATAAGDVFEAIPCFPIQRVV